MSISQTTVVGEIVTPDNLPAAIEFVSFTLTLPDYEDGVLVSPKEIFAAVGPNGEFTVNLWPNDKGLLGTSRYVIHYRLDNGAKIPSQGNIFVPHSPTPLSIEDLILPTALSIKPYVAKIVSEAQFESLLRYDDNTIYLIKKDSVDA